MKNIITLLLPTLLVLTSSSIFAQLDTLDMGDYRLVTNQADTSYTVYSESLVVDGFFVPTAVLATKLEAVDFLYSQADQLYSSYGAQEVKARESRRRARYMSQLLQEVDTFKVQDIALSRYGSQLLGKYVLTYNEKRSTLVFDERLISVRAGERNLRMILFSNNNMRLVNLEDEPIDFYAEELGDFWGVDASGNNVRLRKRK